MSIFLQILLHVIVPVFLLIIIGAFLHRKFQLDLHTLSKLNMYLLMPAVSFVSVYQNKIPVETFVYILIFLVLQSSILMILSAGIAKVAKFDNSLTAAFKNSIVLINSGNFGLPVSQLVFYQNPLGTSIQVAVMIYQNLLTYTYGLFNSVAAKKSNLKAIKEFLKNPVIYAFLLGVTFQMFNLKVPDFLWKPLTVTANAFLAVALITLGAQSALLKIKKFSLPLVLSLLGRLALGPIVAFLIIVLLNFEGTVAQALFIASSFPTSRNSSLLALEYDNHPEYAAQVVLLTTIFSMITVTAVIYLSMILF